MHVGDAPPPLLKRFFYDPRGLPSTLLYVLWSPGMKTDGIVRQRRQCHGSRKSADLAPRLHADCRLRAVVAIESRLLATTRKGGCFADRG